MAETLSEAAPMDRFLLPLIGELRLNLGLNPRRCPGGPAKQRNAYLITLIRHKQNDSKRKREGSAKVKTGEEERGFVLQSYN